MKRRTSHRLFLLGPRKIGALLLVIVISGLFFLTNPTPSMAVIFAAVVITLLMTMYLIIDLKRFIRAQTNSVRNGHGRLARSSGQMISAPQSTKSTPYPALPQVASDVKRARERLWLGYTSRALDVLSNASTEIETSPATRSLAFLELATWHVANDDWSRALEAVQLARVAQPKPNARQIALEIDALIATGDPLSARRLLELQTIMSRSAAAFHLRQANTYLLDIEDAMRFESDGKRLEHLNQLYRDNGLAPVAPTDSGKPLTITNLRAAISESDAVEGELVSVLMPAYNAERTLAHSVGSLLAQTWGNIELIIIDDASSDDTATVAQALAEQDNRVRLIRKTVNEGPYAARNAGLELARGTLVAVHDADDWAHPQKIEKQVEAWRASSNGRASVSFHVRVDDRLQFLKPTRRHRVELVAKNLSSLMVERTVFEEIGAWDEVRAAGDSEFVGRLRAYFGDESIVETAPHVPLSLSLSSSTSLTGDSATGFASMNHVLGARSQYRAAFREWHSSPNFSEDLPLRGSPTEGKPFLRPKVLTTPRTELKEAEHFDVILISNLSLPGGTTASNVQEIRAQKRAGMKTGLIHHPVYDWGASRPPNPKILNEVDGEAVRFLSLGEIVSCDLLIVRLPKAVETLLDDLPSITPKNIIVLANQTPDRYYRSDGVRHPAYDVQKVTTELRNHFGIDPLWYPIGPRVRHALIDWHSRELDLSLLSDTDWVNIIDASEWRRAERRVPDGPFRIGRHSRDSDVKWPTDPDVLRAAYPDSPEFQISVLGGASIPEQILGGLPDNWEVFPFDSVTPREFLASLDAYVYFTPPGMIEAFGRGLLEALAVGVPLVTSSEFEELFGDAAIYAEPSSVVEIMRKLRDDPVFYAQQVERGFELIERKFSYDAHIQRLRKLARNQAQPLNVEYRS